MPITRRGNRRRRNYLSVHLKLTGTLCRIALLQNFHPCRDVFFFFRNGRRRQPTDSEEQQFPEEYPDLRDSSRISNKFSAKHVTNEFHGTGAEGRRKASYIYTIVENFNYLTAHNPVMTRRISRALSLSFIPSVALIVYYFRAQVQTNIV